MLTPKFLTNISIANAVNKLSILLKKPLVIVLKCAEVAIRTTEKKKNFLNANLKISYQYFYSKCSEQIKYTAKVAIGKCPIIQLTETLL